jgi:arylsulfatase A-like enzyme
MDVRIGKVVEQLKLEGLIEDTIVIFFADNGRLEPRGIHWCYDSGLRVPLIIRWPRNFPAPAGLAAGQVDDRMLSLIDLTAITLAMAEIEVPIGMQGRPLFDIDAAGQRKYVFSARDRIDETYQRIRSVRSRDYHYIRTYSSGPTFASLNRYKEKCFLIMPLMRQWLTEGRLSPASLELMTRQGPCEELYAPVEDPWEIRNLVDSSKPSHRQALTELRAVLEAWVVESADRGVLAEPPAVAAAIEAEMKAWFGTPDWATAAIP